MESGKNFTPGPWEWFPCTNDGGRITAPNSTGHSRSVASTLYQENPEEHNSNAYLIAAAPDLYEALNGILTRAVMGDMDELVESHPLLAHWLDKGITALTKARGEHD